MDYEEAKKKYISEVVLLILILLGLYWACSMANLFTIIIATLAAGASIYRIHKYHNIVESTKAKQTPEEDARQDAARKANAAHARESVTVAASAASPRVGTGLSSRRPWSVLLSIASCAVLVLALIVLLITVIALSKATGLVHLIVAVFQAVVSAFFFVISRSLWRHAKSMRD